MARFTAPSRRVALSLVAGAVFWPLGPRAQTGGDVIVVSREQMLREVKAARILSESERTYTAELQRQIDEAKEAFAAEEAELTELRDDLTAEQFTERVADFDRRMRLWRRVAQERAGALQRGFQDSRARIVAALPGVLERLRKQSGARAILNADMVLVVDPSADKTVDAVRLYNETGPAPVIPQIDLSLPLLPPRTSEPEEAPAPQQ